MVFDELGVEFELVAEKVEEGCFDAAEAVVEIGDVGSGKGVGVVVALSCQTVDDWAAWVAEIHDFGGFVDGFAGGVVDGLT